MDLIEFLNARLDNDTAATTIMASPTKWRVLREVEAKRAIIRMRAEMDRHSEWDAVTLDAVIEHLAAAYRDHPDYRPEWKP